MKSNKTNNVELIFQELNDYWTCGHISRLTLKSIKRKPNELYWHIEKNAIMFNKTAEEMPLDMVFIKV